MQRDSLKSRRISIRNRLMLACAIGAAFALATPAAMARGHYHYRGNSSANVLGALVVGAVIGGVLVSASQQHNAYYGGGYYYPPQPYPSQGYYGGYAAPYPAYPAYPAYTYGTGGYYGYPAYGGGVSVGVVYSSGGYRGNYYGAPRGYYDRGYYDRGSYGRGSDGRGGYGQGNYGHGSYGHGGGSYRGNQGHYYSRARGGH